jgi:RNA polymerase sigma factor (sigma-70 family)
MDSTLRRPGSLQSCGTEIAEGERGDENPEERWRARFEVFWSENVAELQRRSLRWTSGRQEDADDALGQAALVALEKMPQELQPEEVRRWLLRLVYSKCMDIHRHRHRSRYVTWDVGNPSPENEIEAAGPGLESMLLTCELVAVAHDRIRRLPPRLRGVAELHLLRDEPYSEIADLLSLTEVNIRKRMQEARALLREHIHAYLAGDAGIQIRNPDEDESSQNLHQPEPLQVSGWTLEALEKYVHRHPRSWKRRWELALRLHESGALDEAILHFREATSRQPRRMELWSDLGTALLLLNRNEEARAAFEAALGRAKDEADRTRLQDWMAQC